MITEGDVKKVARLAHIEIRDEDIPRLTRELSAIIAYVETINELKLEDIRPTAHAVEVKNVFREDVALQAPDVTGKTLEKAPQADGGFFRVPKVI